MRDGDTGSVTDIVSLDGSRAPFGRRTFVGVLDA